ncbi:BlaI/MecI/CopY family transcriptional regulator [Alteromonadaceae bacterium M269]|nr:BlaI/MecI/CopY family transcriptional regulator [Alteromonadaceae bacterium M269]
MINSISISDTEKEVMEVLWYSSPLTASQITSSIQKEREMHPNTVKTLLNRLVKKQVVSYKEEGRKFLYYPLVARETFYHSQTERFLDQFYGGRVSSLISHFAENERLSDDEVEQIKTLIKKMEQSDE